MVTKKVAIKKAIKWDNYLTKMYDELSDQIKEFYAIHPYFGAVKFSLQETLYQLKGTIIELRKE